MIGETFAQIKEKEEALLFRTYGRYPVAVKEGRGSRLIDYDGKEYVDLLAGIAVTALGHSNEELAETAAAQARKLVHVSNLFYQREQLILAEALLATAHFGKAFFCNSGAEANEAAIKLARRYHQRVKNTQAYEIVTFEGAFHGRTLATIAATGQERFTDGFAPIPEGFTQVAWGDLRLLEKTVTDKTAGVLLEIVQGEGGIRPAAREFAEGVQAICREKGALFMADEVQCGMGRTGRWWGFQHFNLKPDIMSTAKALANGMPMGCMMAVDEVAAGFVTGSHATTFGAGALLSTVAAKVIEIINRDKLTDRAAELGAYAVSRFRAIGEACPGTISAVRGMGLMIGIELGFQGAPDAPEKSKAVWDELIRRGFIVNLTQGNVLRLLPALTVPKEDIDAFADTLQAVLAKK